MQFDVRGMGRAPVPRFIAVKNFAFLFLFAAACATTARTPVPAAEPPVANASAAFTVANSRDLIPEGIAYDAESDSFFISSIYRRKVVKAGASGVHDFIAEGQEGMLSSLGMKIDAKRRLLWVASCAAPEMRGYTRDDEGKAALFAYNLGDGALVRKLVTGDASHHALLNDLAILDDGTLLVTDSERGAVYRVLPQVDRLEPYLDGFHYPNGIALSDDQHTLFVADSEAITRIDLTDAAEPRKSGTLPVPGVDGLSFYRGDLIAIQNHTANPRVVRIRTGDGSVQTLESGNVLFDIPTTGVVAKDAYYFVANSQLRAFDAQHRIRAYDTLKDPVLLRIPLQ
ncbi:MAG TPA: SMP-30/gluconolactonase/LRE family protein [Thermoanaerobaculia bacterium]|nr:SMP-30/gluconolactonase/LRE family protein [Thermoanaerobaculia bacterium]